MKLNKFIPEGVQDISFVQFEKMEELQQTVAGVFRSKDYRQIMTPTFEYYDLFSGVDLSIDKEQMYKLADENGKLMVLRPDATIPVARMVATNYDGLSGDLKYMYFTNVFRSSDFRAGEKREFTQAGIEYFGGPAELADAEVINTAIAGITACGFTGLKVELGDTKFFTGLMDAANPEMDKSVKNRIRTLVEQKNCPGLAEYLEEIHMEEPYKGHILQLPFLYGPMEDTLKAAEKLALNDKMREAVAHVREIYDKIEQKEYVFADMGSVNHLDYYSGMIFKVYLPNAGSAVGSGGRYDGLLKKFGKDIPAAGFGLNMDVLYEALENREKAAGEGDGEATGMQQEQDSVLRIALGKGRLAEKTIEELAHIGIRFPEYSKSSRKLIFEDETGKVRIVLVKAVDVDIYVEKGACDIGVVGKDTLMENGSDVYEVVDLGYGKCRFCVAALNDFVPPAGKLRVATKYPNVAKNYFNRKGRSIEIIKINGSVELAPIVGLADVIVDIVETGTTLKENGLEVKEVIDHVSARLVVNRVSMKTKQDAVSAVIKALKRK